MIRKVSLIGAAALIVLTLAAATGCGGGETTTTAAPTTQSTAPSTETTGGGAAGADLYAANCAGCHGGGGEGNIGPDLTVLTEADLPAIEDRTRNGGNGMPGFGDTLSDEQIEALAVFVAGLGG